MLNHYCSLVIIKAGVRSKKYEALDVISTKR